MGPAECIGNCAFLFLGAVVFDVVGIILLFLGIFADLRIDGLFYGDFFIYTGSLIIFFSLFIWITWYAVNIQVREDDGLKKRSSFVELARKLSERLSKRLAAEDRVKCVEDVDWSQMGTPPRKSSRVTWGKSTAYHNEGYDNSTDSPALEKKVASATTL